MSSPWVSPSRCRGLGFDSHLLRVPVRSFDRKGEVIYSGSPDAFYYVQQGYVHITRGEPHQRQSHVAIARPGDVFGESRLFPPLRSPETAVALGEVQLMSYSHASIVDKSKKSAEFASLLMELLAARIEDAIVRTRSIEGHRISPRVMHAIGWLAVDLGKEISPGMLELPAVITHEIIGQMASCRREMATFSVTALKRAHCISSGIAQRQRRLVVIMEALEKAFFKEINTPARAMFSDNCRRAQRLGAAA